MVTRQGSKQLTDEERASQVASPTIPPESEREDNGPGGSPFFTPEVMQGVRKAQKKRAKMTPEERAKQRANTRGSAVPEPLEIDDDADENENDSDNDNREDWTTLNTS